MGDMPKQFPRRLYALFAAGALLAVGSVAALILIVHFSAVRGQAEATAADSASRIIAPVVEGSPRENFAQTAQILVGEQVQSIRLLGPLGGVIGTTTGTPPAEVDPEHLAAAIDGELVAFKAAGAQGDVLISYQTLESGGILEIQQDYAPIAGSVASSQRFLLFSVLGGLALLLLLIQGVVWWTTNGLKRDYTRLLHLHNTGLAVRQSLDLDEVLEQLARDAARFTSAHLGAAMIIEEKTNDLIVHATFDGESQSTAQHHRTIEEWYVRRCAGTGEPTQADLPSFPYDAVLGYRPPFEGPVHVLCVMIPGRERPAGVLLVARQLSRGGYKDGEVQVLEEMAAQAAMALDQALLFAKVRSHARELEVSYDSTLKVLVAALDTKDASSQGHSERVSQLAVSLAKEVGVEDDKLLDIERGSLLHDVGKIGVPDTVLAKPDTLDEGEWAAMQKHPLLAGLMVSKVGFLEGAMPILLYHHERFDGTGYPFGLEGEAIPLEARIFAVVDAYQAMTSDRPYRKAMSDREALAEIERSSGAQFDPEIVDAFRKLMARTTPRVERPAA